LKRLVGARGFEPPTTCTPSPKWVVVNTVHAVDAPLLAVEKQLNLPH
jgi:hypothetical protein